MTATSNQKTYKQKQSVSNQFSIKNNQFLINASRIEAKTLQ